MKKRMLSFVVLTGWVCLVAAGCSNSNIDTAKVRAAFPSIDGDAKAQLEQALAAIDASNYAAAVKPLEKAAYEIKMDKNQREILTDTLKKARAKAARQK
jgi:cellobiose-specific phosphotransferase system component IIA